MEKKGLKSWEKPKLEEHSNNIIQTGTNMTFPEANAGNMFDP